MSHIREILVDLDLKGNKIHNSLIGQNTFIVDGAISFGTDGVFKIYANEAILLGNAITARSNDPHQVYVPNFNIITTPLNDDNLTQIMVRDTSTGQIKYRNASSISSSDTASNGITKNVNDFILGGSLTQTTTIDATIYDLDLISGDGVLNLIQYGQVGYIDLSGYGGVYIESFGTGGFGVNLTTTLTNDITLSSDRNIIMTTIQDFNVTSSKDINIIGPDPTKNVLLRSGTTDNGDDNSSIKANGLNLTLESRYVGIDTEDPDQYSTIVLLGDTFTILGSGASFKGAEYDVDYSRFYSDRSLVDKGYVASYVSTGSSSTSGWATNAYNAFNVTATNGQFKINNNSSSVLQLLPAGSSSNIDFNIVTKGDGKVIIGGTDQSAYSAPNDVVVQGNNVYGTNVTSSIVKILGGSSWKTDVAGGSIEILGGSSTAGNANGGSVVINAGVKSGTAGNGSVFIGNDSTTDVYIGNSSSIIRLSHGITTIGYVWTAISTSGDGTWMPSSGGAAATYKTTITGDNSTTDFAITHSLGTRDVIVEVYRNSSPYDTVITTIQRTSTSVVDVIFGIAPTNTDSFKILITVV